MSEGFDTLVDDEDRGVGAKVDLGVVIGWLGGAPDMGRGEGTEPEEEEVVGGAGDAG